MRNQSLLHVTRQPAWLTLGLALTLWLLGGSPYSARADTYTWNGRANGYWGNSANWDHFPPATPGDGDDLVFPTGPTRWTTTNNLGAHRFQSITISGIGYTLRGTGTGTNITLYKGLRATYMTGSSAIELNLQLDHSQTFACRELGTHLNLRGRLNLGGHTLTVDVVKEDGSLALEGVVSGSGTLIKAGLGGLIMRGNEANTYDGTTQVDAGSLTLAKSSGNAIPHGALVIGDGLGGADADVVWETAGAQIGTIPTTINSSGWLNLDAQNDMIGALDLNGGHASTTSGTLTLGGNVTVFNNPDRQPRLEGQIALRSVCTFNVTNTEFSPDLMISATISGSGGILKTGPGSLGLCAANTFSGLVTVRDGALCVYHGHALGADDAGTVVESGGVLILANSTEVALESLTLNGNGNGTMGALSSMDGGIWWGPASSSWSGLITLDSDSSVYVPAGAFLSLPGPIGGHAGLTKTGPGTLIFSGISANCYGGATRVDEGTLFLAKIVWDVAVPGHLIIGDGVGGPDADVVRLGNAHQIARNSNVVLTNTGLLDLSNPSVELSGHAEGFNGLFGVGHVHVGTNALAICVDGACSTFDGLITDASGWSGTTLIGGRLGKHGSGAFVLNGTNKCHGTIVWGGELVVNGAQKVGPTVLAPGTTLSGVGRLEDILSAGGTVSPGFLSPGRLTGKNLTLDESSTYQVHLTGRPGASACNQLRLLYGSTRLSNPGLAMAVEGAPVYGQSFVIIKNDSLYASDPWSEDPPPDAVRGQFRDLPNGATFEFGPATYQIHYDGGGGNDVVLEVVGMPLEPMGVQVSTGNGNGFVEPNECNLLYIVLRNTTTLPITGIRTELATTSPHVLVHQAASTYPDLPPGGCATNLTPFQVSTLPSLPCGAYISLELTVATASHSPFVLTPELPLGPPGTPVRIDEDADLTIPDVDLTASSVAVSGFNGQLADVQVSVHITHTAVGDLSLWLVGPDGTSVALSRTRGGTLEDFGTSCEHVERTWFSDSAAHSIGEGSAPFVGMFRPEEPLLAFRGKYGAAVNGTWELRVADDAAGTVGSLRCWSLLLVPPECPAGGGFCMPCPDQVIRGSIDATDPALRRVLRQDGHPSVCGTWKRCPGVTDLPPDAWSYYDAYTFQNGASNSCVRVELVAPESPGRLFSVAYRDRFNSMDPCANYLADSGSAGSPFYSFMAGPGEVFVVTVLKLVGPGPVPSYELRVSGGSCVPWLSIRPVPENKVVISWPTFASDFHLDHTNVLDNLSDVCIPVPERLVVIDHAYTVTNTCRPAIRFYQLHKP